MNQEKLAKLQAQVRIGGKVSRRNSIDEMYMVVYLKVCGIYFPLTAE